MKQLLRCYMGLVIPLASLIAAPSAVTFTQNQASVDAYSFVEVELRVAGPDARNPFTDLTVADQS